MQNEKGAKVPKPPVEDSAESLRATIGGLEVSERLRANLASDVAEIDRRIDAMMADQEVGFDPIELKEAVEPIAHEAEAWRSAAVEHIERERNADEHLLAELEYAGPVRSDAQDFNGLQVEQLVQEASDLLDRCITEKSRWNDLAVSRFLLTQETQEFIRLDEVHRDEVRAGFYTLAFEIAKQAKRSADATARAHELTAIFTETTLREHYDYENLVAVSGWLQLRGWLSSLPQGAKHDATWNGVKKKKSDWLHDAATELSYNALNLEERAEQRKRVSATQHKYAAQALSALEKLRMEWSKADIEFRRRRTQIAREIAQAKADAIRKEGGALNYTDRMVPIRERFELDFAEAIARMRAVVPFLDSLYGYRETLPESMSHNSALLWVRAAIHFLNRFARSEQNSVKCISLRQLLGENEWRTGLARGRWSFALTDEHFSRQRHVRMRGISAFVVGEGIEGLWAMRALPPRSGVAVHADNSRRTINQSTVPPCHLGRVARRRQYMDPDIVGVASLHNASPIGTWLLEIDSRSTHNEVTTSLADVHLDLYLAFQSGSSGRARG